jgi:gamma-glutamylputrescine oxidase
MISIWERETYYRDVDVLIAGGGFMAMWTAYELLKRNPNLKITIAEASPVAALASTRNAGFACFGSPSELWSDLHTMGENAMWQVVEMRFKGIEKIRRIWGDNAIGYDPIGGYEVFAGQPEWEGSHLAEKLTILNKGLAIITGEKNTYRDTSDVLKSMKMDGFSAMAGNNMEGGLHSGQLAATMAAWLHAAGVVMLTGHKVGNVSDSNSGQSVSLQAGQKEITIRSKAMIWATNAALEGVAGVGKKVVPARGQVLLSPPIDGLKLKGTFHFDEGYYYFRNLGNRLLLGGARNTAFSHEQTHLAEPTSEIQEYLKAFIISHLPEAAQAMGKPGWMEWAGIMGMSEDKNPIIKETAPGIWAALACNGMGVALTPVVAEDLATQVIGQVG